MSSWSAIVSGLAASVCSTRTVLVQQKATDHFSNHHPVPSVCTMPSPFLLQISLSISLSRLDSMYDALSSVCVEKGDEAIMGVSFTMISLLREWHPRPRMVSNVFLSGSIRPVDRHWSWIFHLTAPSQHCTAMFQIWQKHSNFYLFKNCSQNARARKWNKFYITVAQK